MKRLAPFLAIVCLALPLIACAAFSQVNTPTPTKLPTQTSLPEATDPAGEITTPETTLYDITADPVADLQQAISQAQKEHKRILIEVGGEWCVWCHIMHKFYEDHPTLLKLREDHYVLIRVNYSEENQNAAFLTQYPEIDGYPHIFVLESNGKLLHSQNTGELEEGNSYNLVAFTSFLEAWASKPTSTPTTTSLTANRDLLLDISNIDMCGEKEIWLARAPYQNPQALLADKNKDYLAGTWSANGEGIAYIASSPCRTGEEKAQPEADTLWVMRADGSEQRQIGSVPPEGVMMNRLEWSPDGKYIVFIHDSQGGQNVFFSYYISEVSTGKTKLLLTVAESPENIFWLSTNQLAIFNHGTLPQQVDIESIESIKVQNMPWNEPEELKNRLYNVLKSEGNTLYVFFPSAPSVASMPNQTEIWSYDLTTKAWEKITIIPKRTWEPEQIIVGHGLQWDSENYVLTLFDLPTWAQTHVINVPILYGVSLKIKSTTDQSGNLLFVIHTLNNLYTLHLEELGEMVPSLLPQGFLPDNKFIVRFDFKP